MRDLLSVEILCYTANHRHLPTAKALQIFGCGHLGLNASSGIRCYYCSLWIESRTMALIHESEIGLKHYFLKLNIFNHCSTQKYWDLHFDSANITDHWSLITDQCSPRLLAFQSPAFQFNFHSFVFKIAQWWEEREEKGAAYSLSVQT